MALSCLDEKSIYGADYYLETARNEILVLVDRNGEKREFIDCMSAYASCNFGHCNPEIMPFNSLQSDIAACFYPREAEQYSQWLINRLGIDKYELLFQIGGSAAVSTALSLALRKRSGKIAYVRGSFHGLGLDALAVTSIHKHFALQNTLLVDEVQKYCIEIVPEQLADIPWENISCLIFEVIQGANGYTPLPHEWLIEVTRLAQIHHVVVISDEIQCGFFRHGHLSMARHLGIEADIFLFSKSMTNGLFPFSAVVYRTNFKQEVEGNLYLAHTFQTSSLGCYAAMAVANYIDRTPPTDLCRNVENVIREYAEKIKYYPFIGNLNITGPTLSFEVFHFTGKMIVQKCLTRGILVFTGGSLGQRIRFAPPITISHHNLIYALDQLLLVLHELSFNLETIV